VSCWCWRRGRVRWILSHVNDAGFWLVKQYFNMTVAETFKTWTAMETILSIVALIFIMLLSLVV